MKIIGLTGSIGMGKTTVAAQFAALGAKTISADAIVHRLMGRNGAAVAQVGKYFPGVIRDAAVDRKRLGAIVFNDDQQRELLEQIIHPLVVAEEERWACVQRRLGAMILVLDIPLLFETGAETRCDVTVVVTAPHHIQRRRVLARPGMTEEIFRAVLARQMPDMEKCRRADAIVQTGLGRGYSMRHVKSIVEALR